MQTNEFFLNFPSLPLPFLFHVFISLFKSLDRSSPPSPSEYSLTRAMNALLARQRCPCSAKPARDQDRPAVAARPAISSTATAAFRTKLGGGGGEAETTHDGSSPVVLRVRGGATSLSLEERAGRVYATAELDNGSKKGGDGDGDLFFSAGPPPPSGVFLAGAGAELRPGTSYLLSPGAEISFTDAATGGETSVTVDYEVSENDGIGGLGEMLARAMAAQASDEVRAKLDDVF